MNNKPAKGELPVVADIDYDVRRDIWQNGEIKIIEIEDVSNEHHPDYFKCNDYAILFIRQGTLRGQFNLIDVDLSAPAAMYIFNSHTLHYIDNSPDLKIRTLSYSPTMAEEITLPMQRDFLRYAYVRPATALTDEVMQVTMQYLDLLSDLIRNDNENMRPVIVHFLRSLIVFLLNSYAESVSLLKPLTRVEDIAGRFLSLVDIHCTEHHDINWYADQLHLSPKYIMYVVKKVTEMSAGNCISEHLVSQAKSLLLTSTFSIQQISDRLGFQNQSHFGTFFRRKVGVSPLAFRTGKVKS